MELAVAADLVIIGTKWFGLNFLPNPPSKLETLLHIIITSPECSVVSRGDINPLKTLSYKSEVFGYTDFIFNPTTEKGKHGHK